MRRMLTIMLLLAAFSAGAQESRKIPTEYKGRIAAEFDQKLARGLHATLNEELCFEDRFSGFDKSTTTLGITYKIYDWLRLGAGYSFIADLGDESEIRHRGTFDATGSLRAGSWRFSLRERFQSTTKTADINLFQQPRTSLDLKSRLKCGYVCNTVPLKPYAEVEFRHRLNAVESSLLPEISYCDCYLSRTRVALGTEWQIDGRNALDFRLMLDNNDKIKVDATRKGRLKGTTELHGGVLSIGIRYKFSRK